MIIKLASYIYGDYNGLGVNLDSCTLDQYEFLGVDSPIVSLSGDILISSLLNSLINLLYY